MLLFFSLCIFMEVCVPCSWLVTKSVIIHLPDSAAFARSFSIPSGVNHQLSEIKRTFQHFLPLNLDLTN